MDSFQNSLPMLLNQTLDTVIPSYRKVFKQYNITEQQWRILRVLWENDRCTTFELSSKTLLPGPSMVGIIDRMKTKGLVTRDRSSEDRRKVFVCLTDLGQSLEKELTPKIDEIHRNIVNRCNKDDWKTMVMTLRTIIESEESLSNEKA